ncbi:MAG: autotransporter domain-containing protein [Nitrosomonadales bacterium]|nr:autotransporter domain-containing protein [Nitrosomonadales bacterium]
MHAGQSFALCNSGVTVTSTLVVSENCNGSNIKGLTLDTGADVTINSGVTVTNDAPFGVNGRAVVVLSTSTSANLVNNGSIYTYNQWGLWVQVGGNVSVVNFGQIIGDVRYGISNQGTISSLTNVGTIRGGFGSIGNGATPAPTIGVFNNLQGQNGLVSSAVTLVGYLPLEYNVIIRDLSSYGQLSAPGSLGTMAFNIYGNAGTTPVSGVNASAITANRYLSVLKGFTSLSGVTGVEGTYGAYHYSLVANETVANSWDLLVFLSGPSAADTQASLQNSARKLRSVFNLAAVSSNFANMNTYDCNLFDANGVCVSAGGRYTNINSPDSSSSNAVLVMGYKATPNIRIGGFVDRSLINNAPSGINISNSDPLMGAFAVWNKNADGLGYQVKIANAYQDRDVNIRREVIGTSEAGRGDTNLKIQSYVGEISYAFKYNEDTILRPYLALRHTSIKQDGYTEKDAATPLTYDSLEDRTLSALFGLKLNYRMTPRATLTSSLGIEHDLEHHVDGYSAKASGISGLTSENFDDSIKRTRPVASAGAYYAVSKKQRISGDVYYQQLPFQGTGSTTAYVNYMIGF